MAGKKSRSKGYRGEKELRDKCTDMGLDVVWTAEDPVAPDCLIGNTSVEVKYGKHVPKKIYDWLYEKNAQALAIKRVSNEDRGNEWLIVSRLEDFF